MAARCSVERLRELLNYDPETGLFTWRVRAGSRGRVGAVAGFSAGRGGYMQIGVDGEQHYSHRLAWLYVYGQWPLLEIDHINGDRRDNRIANLRDVTPKVNRQNRRAPASAKAGLLGVGRHHRRYTATIGTEGRTIYLGLFATPEEAHAAYVAAKRKLHEGCTI